MSGFEYQLLSSDSLKDGRLLAKASRRSPEGSQADAVLPGCHRKPVGIAGGTTEKAAS